MNSTESHPAITPARPRLAAQPDGQHILRVFCAARTALGITYVLWSARSGSQQTSTANSRAGAVAAILGARHIAQAMLTARHPTRAVLALGAEADAAHAISMAALSILSGQWRRLALSDAMVATSLAWAGFACTRPGPQPASVDHPSRHYRDVPFHSRSTR